MPLRCEGCGAELAGASEPCPECGGHVGAEERPRWSVGIIAARSSLALIGALWGVTVLLESGAVGLLVFPPLAFLVARCGIERSPTAWAIALGVPGAVAVVVGRVILHSPEAGASFRLVSMLLVFLVSGLTAAGCAIGTHRSGPRGGRGER